MPVFKYTVDGEEQDTDKQELTATEIMQKAKIDPTKNYLVEMEGEHQNSFKDDPNKNIHMHENMIFVTVALKEGHPLSGFFL